MKRKIKENGISNRQRALRDSLNREIRRFLAEAILFNQQLADRLGINATDYQILNLLDLFGPATPGDLAQLTDLSSGGMTVVIDRLEKAGYLRAGTQSARPPQRDRAIRRRAQAPDRQSKARRTVPEQ